MTLELTASAVVKASNASVTPEVLFQPSLQPAGSSPSTVTIKRMEVDH